MTNTIVEVFLLEKHCRTFITIAVGTGMVVTMELRYHVLCSLSVERERELTPSRAALPCLVQSLRGERELTPPRAALPCLVQSLRGERES